MNNDQAPRFRSRTGIGASRGFQADAVGGVFWVGSKVGNLERRSADAKHKLLGGSGDQGQSSVKRRMSNGS